MPPRDPGHPDAHGRGSQDPGQMGPLLAGDTRPMGDEPSDAITAGHETAEVRVSPAAKFLTGLGVGAAIIFILIYTLLLAWRNAAVKAQPPLPPLVSSSRGRLPPEPRLQITPLRDYQVFLAAQDSLLHSYGWVNRESLMVRIPISRAMDLLVRRGVPVRAAVPKPPAEETGSTAPAETREGGEPSGRLPRGDLRLRPPIAPVVPVPADSTNDSTHGPGKGGP
jgi:hypothetical protein